MIMERKTRVPTQKRALDKVENIIEAAFRLFNEKGYYNTTTQDIAREANVATGSVYSYFEDKKDIYIQVLRKVNESFDYPTHDFWVKNQLPLDNAEAAKELFSMFLKLMINQHNFSKTFHDDMEAQRLLDKDIKEIYAELDERRIQMTREIFEIISIPFKSDNDADIFLHYSLILIDDLCHRSLYDNTLKDTDLLDKCVHMLYSLFEVTTNRTKADI
jgi:Transcriptional regulator